MSKEYLTKDIAAKRSGRSVRRLLELAAAGKIRKVIQPDPQKGNRLIALFNAEDIRNLSKLPTGPTTAALTPARHNGATSHPGSHTIQHGRLPYTPEPAELPTKPWMTIEQAAGYTGLPGSFLSRLIETGKLKALDVGVRPGGRWRVSKRDLDTIEATKHG